MTVVQPNPRYNRISISLKSNMCMPFVRWYRILQGIQHAQLSQTSIYLYMYIYSHDVCMFDAF